MDSMDTFQTVLVGIASSLIATFLFLSFAWLLKNIVLPWYADKIYRGVRIDGRWKIDIDDEDGNCDIDATVELNQKGDNVTGVYSHEVKSKNDITTYRLCGEVRNTYLNAAIWPISQEQFDTGSFVLRIYSKSGLRMKGVVTFISTEDGSVESAEIEFVKSDS